MKRVYPWLLFVAVVVTAVILDSSREAGNDDLVFRFGLWSVVAILTVWKIGDFWKRHRRRGGVPPASGPEDPGAGAGKAA